MESPNRSVTPCARRWCVALLVPALLVSLGACNRQPETAAPFVVTIPPLKLILQEIVGEPSQVACILPPGSSPHTFELRPSIARQLAEAQAVFYVDGSIDGWVARSVPEKLHAVFPMVPPAYQLAYDMDGAHDHGHDDAASVDSSPMNAHFWPDPLAVQAVVPRLVEVLAELHPSEAARYRANGERFSAALDKLDKELRANRPAPGDYSLAAFHPSWQYFCHRYDIQVAAYIEPFPGKEPTPRALQALQDVVGRSAHRIILSEVQLPAKPAEVLAESLGASVTMIDPLGGAGERTTYAGLLRYNAARLWEAMP